MNTDEARARWNERFGAPGYLFGTAPNAFLAGQAARIKPGMDVLAVADGEGRNGVWLARQGARVTAVDFSPVALAKARALAAEAGVALDTIEADLAAWTWPKGAYDAVVAIFIQFADPALRRRLFASMIGALKPGGFLMLQGYRPKQLEYKTGGPPHAENLYTADLLRRELAGLEILHLAEHDSVIAEGTGHKGMSALIDFVGRKPG
jgi:SAM-dependent methyltransferase